LGREAGFGSDHSRATNFFATGESSRFAQSTPAAKGSGDGQSILAQMSVQQSAMKTIAGILLAVVALGFVVVPSRAGEETDKNLTKQISDVLGECKKIAPGATRAELLKIFTTEGGLSTAGHRTFVHRRCPYLKVDVDFLLSDPKRSAVDERPTDTVSKISKPYLEWSISD
jgi:hypothetical protein